MLNKDACDKMAVIMMLLIMLLRKGHDRAISLCAISLIYCSRSSKSQSSPKTQKFERNDAHPEVEKLSTRQQNPSTHEALGTASL